MIRSCATGAFILGVIVAAGCSRSSDDDLRKAQEEAAMADAAKADAARTELEKLKALEEPAVPAVADLAGEWKIAYTNNYVRLYVIDEDGKVKFDAEGITGQIKPGEAALLVEFDQNDQLERLTLRSDGQLFVEHYNPKADYPDKKPTTTGIGVRQK